MSRLRAQRTITFSAHDPIDKTDVSPLWSPAHDAAPICKAEDASYIHSHAPRGVVPMPSATHGPSSCAFNQSAQAL
jgi:hypothetical protein